VLSSFSVPLIPQSAAARSSEQPAADFLSRIHAAERDNADAVEQRNTLFRICISTFSSVNL
jgi:hypothetical protein